MNASLERCYNIADLRDLARRRLPKGIFEAIDRGTEDEVALAGNRAAFQRIKLRTRFLTDLSNRDMGTDLLGTRSALPFGIAPTGMAGLLWYEGELALARAAAKAGIPFTLAMGALTSMETIAREAGGRLWFQLYLWEDIEGSHEMVRRAADLGYEALVVTIDSGLGRAREYNERNGFSFPFKPNPRAIAGMLRHPGWLWNVLFRYLRGGAMPDHANYPARYRSLMAGEKRLKPRRHEAMTWEDIRRLRQLWPGKLIVKSILGADEARLALECGADAIVVSNHGGRSLDSAPAPIEVLPEIVAAVKDRCTIMLDSGIRRGSDIVKALALGADFVLVGRATLYGVASGGEAGASHAIGILADEMERTFGSIGCRRVSEAGPHVVANAWPPA